MASQGKENEHADLAHRHRPNQQMPDMKQLRRELGWDLVEAQRNTEVPCLKGEQREQH